MCRVLNLSALLLFMVVAPVAAQTPRQVVQLPVSSGQLTDCVVNSSTVCASRAPRLTFNALPTPVKQALRQYGDFLERDAAYPGDLVDAVYFLLGQQGDIQPLLSWTDSVAIKMVLATVRQGKVVDVLPVANAGPDETQVDSFNIDTDQSIRVYRQLYDSSGDQPKPIGKKRLLGVYRIQPDGKIRKIKSVR